jgi:hypothetical protein
MKKQWVVGLLGAAMSIAVVMLWLRVRNLENTVDSLTRQLQAKPGVITVRSSELEQSKEADGKHVFKLIDAAPPKDGATEVGVPWSVEHGMMLDAAEHAEPRPEAPKDEWRNEIYDNGPPVELREQLFQQPQKSVLNDGDFN